MSVFFTECIWAAGLFEGEGTVTLSSAGRRGYTRLAVIVASTDPEIIKFFHDRWPGVVRSFRPRSTARARQAFEWRLSGPRAAEFLCDIREYVRTGRVMAKIDLGLLSQAARIHGRSKPGAAEQQRAWAAQMRVLNKRGVA